MITQVKFIGIPTRDQHKALQFYTTQLGFEVVTDQPFDAKQRWIELRIGDSPTRVVLFTPVEFDGEPQKQPWGTFAMFKDPDGNQFVLSSG